MGRYYAELQVEPDMWDERRVLRIMEGVRVQS